MAVYSTIYTVYIFIYSLYIYIYLYIYSNILYNTTILIYSYISPFLNNNCIQVKSIAGNKLIEINEKISYKNDSLPFPTPTVDIVINMSISELETHLSNIYKLLQKTLISAQTTIPTIAASNALYDRLNSLGYLYNISTCAEVRNMGFIMILYIKLWVLLYFMLYNMGFII